MSQLAPTYAERSMKMYVLCGQTPQYINPPRYLVANSSVYTPERATSAGRKMGGCCSEYQNEISRANKYSVIARC